MKNTEPAIELMSFEVGWETALAKFLHDIEEAGELMFFDPHRSDLETLHMIATCQGRDVYRIMVIAGEVVAYGMLRGWNEGYDVPSLGVAVRSDYRGRGLAHRMMAHLEHEAASRGAAKVRLRVHSENAAALNLYSKRGYKFSADPAIPSLIIGVLPVCEVLS